MGEQHAAEILPRVRKVRGGRMSDKSIREKCSNYTCLHFYPNRKAVLTMAPSWDFGGYSEGTGWYGEIECTTCGRRIEYVGSRTEKKADVERTLRKLWHVANMEVGEDA